MNLTTATMLSILSATITPIQSRIGGGTQTDSWAAAHPGKEASPNSVAGRLLIKFDDSPMETFFYILDIDSTDEIDTVRDDIDFNKNDQPVFFGNPFDLRPSPQEERVFEFEMKPGHLYQFVLYDTNHDGFKGSFVITTVDGSGRRSILSQGLKNDGPFQEQAYNFSL